MNVTLFTDASHDWSNGVGSWGCWAKSNRGRIEYAGVLKAKPETTNGCEMAAVANGLVVALKSGVMEPGDRVIVCTDSLHVVGRLSGKPHRQRRQEANFEKAIRAFVAEHRLSFECRHVKGHVKSGDQRNYVNRLVDKLATTARKRHRRKTEGGIAA